MGGNTGAINLVLYFIKKCFNFKRVVKTRKILIQKQRMKKIKKSYFKKKKVKIPYTVVRSNKAKASRIDITIREMRVTVSKNSRIKPFEFIAQKEDWIIKKWKEFEKLRDKIPKRKFTPGSKWPYKGKKKTLAVRNVPDSFLEKDKIILSGKKVKKNGVKLELERFYKKEARKYFTELVDKWSDKYGVEYRKIYIKNQKTRWGSCSNKGNINLNWRLIMTRPDISEYVVAHEVTHLIEKSHSPGYWGILSKHCDNIKEKKRWLKDNSPSLIFTEKDL